MSNINVIEHKGALVDPAKIGIVVSRFNSFIVDRLSDAAIKTLRLNGIENKDMTVVKVPGAFEIPIATAVLLAKNRYSAIITLGAIIRGETAHFEYIANECARGISSLAIEYGVPVIFGVLTVNDVRQAIDRAGDGDRNKGSEAAVAALEMIGVLEKIKT